MNDYDVDLSPKNGGESYNIFVGSLKKRVGPNLEKELTREGRRNGRPFIFRILFQNLSPKLIALQKCIFQIQSEGTIYQIESESRVWPCRKGD